MSAFASYASSVNSPNNVLPPVHNTGMEGSSYKYVSSAGGRKSCMKRSGKSYKNYKNHMKRGGKSYKNHKNHMKRSGKSYKNHKK